MRVVAFDPGKTTGMYVVEDAQHGGYHRWMQVDFESLCHTLAEMEYEDEIVFVVEKYIIPPRAFNAPWSLEAIGAIKFVALMEGIKVVMQRAADAKNVASDDNLREWYWYDRKCNDHARDAQRHAALYLLKESTDGKLPVPASRSHA